MAGPATNMVPQGKAAPNHFIAQCLLVNSKMKPQHDTRSCPLAQRCFYSSAAAAPAGAAAGAAAPAAGPVAAAASDGSDSAAAGGAAAAAAVSEAGDTVPCCPAPSLR